MRSKKPLSPRFALRSSGLCLLCHPLGGFDPAAAHRWFSLCGHRFSTGHLLSFHRSAHRCWLKSLRQSTDLRSNAGMRLFYFSLDRLIEKDGDLLNCLILCRLFSVRAFYRQAMDLGGQCLQLSLFHNYPR